MNKIPNKRSFNYDVKSLLAYPPIPPIDEVSILISGLSSGSWNGLGNGTHNIDVIEIYNPDYDMIQEIKFDKNTSLPINIQGGFRAKAEYRGFGYGQSDLWIYYYKVGDGAKTKQIHTYTMVSQDIGKIALWHTGGVAQTIQHNNDTVSITISRGADWDRGNMS